MGFEYAGYLKGHTTAELEARAELEERGREVKDAMGYCLDRVMDACLYQGIDFWLLKSYLLKYGNDYMRSEYQWPKTSKAGLPLRRSEAP
jgi:hypothetical protein